MMSIDGLGLRSSYLGSSLLNLRSQLDDLQQQLATGKKSITYSGLGVDRGFAMSLRSQLSNLTSYKDTITNVNLRLNVGNSVLQRMTAIGAEMKGASAGATTKLGDDGKTIAQGQAENGLAEMLQLLNTRAGDRYLFSGRAVDTPSVATLGDIMDGSGAKAGLKQIIAERNAADLGANGLGRLGITAPTTTSVSIAEDAAGSPFGMKLSAVTSSLGGAPVTGPTGSPPSATVDLTTNPTEGQKIKFSFNLPDGTIESIELTASNATPLPAGSFAIGATSADTATNLQTTLTASVGKLANTSLVAASALTASDNFFASSPPLRVNGPPFDSATSLVNGTPANTVSWYTGEDTSDPARGTSTARIDDAIAVQYGARANEQGLRWQLQTLAAYAAVSTSPQDPNASGQLLALSSRVNLNFGPQSGQQSIQDIQADFAGAQTAMKAASDRQAQTTTMTQTMLDSIEGISDEEVATKIIALQTSLQASYQTTSRLYQTSLLNYL
jgi:flagellar hook-associated protein 3 FlgL